MATVKQISAGIYEVDGKRVNAKSKDEALRAASKSSGKTSGGKSGGKPKNAADVIAGGDKNISDAAKAFLQFYDENFKPPTVENGQLFSTDPNKFELDNRDRATKLADTPATLSPEALASLGAADDALAGMKDVASKTGINSAEYGYGVDKGKEMINSAQNLTPEQQDLINQLKSDYESSKSLTPEEQAALDVQRGRLGGLTPEQITAAVEGGIVDANGNPVEGALSLNNRLNRGIEATLGAAKATGGARGVGAAGLVNPVVSDYIDRNNQLMQNLVLKNRSIADNAAQNFAETARLVTAGRDARVGNAGQTYGSAVGNAEDNRTNRIKAALDFYDSFVGGMQGLSADQAKNIGLVAGDNASRRVGADQFLMDENARRNENLYNINTNISDRQTDLINSNMNTLQNYSLGRMGAFTGGAGFGLTRSGNEKANDLAEKNIEMTKSLYGGGGTRRTSNRIGSDRSRPATSISGTSNGFKDPVL